jgi:hypothetical protein
MNERKWELDEEENVHREYFIMQAGDDVDEEEHILVCYSDLATARQVAAFEEMYAALCAISGTLEEGMSEHEIEQMEAALKLADTGKSE